VELIGWVFAKRARRRVMWGFGHSALLEAAMGDGPSRDSRWLGRLCMLS